MCWVVISVMICVYNLVEGVWWLYVLFDSSMVVVCENVCV